MKELTKDDFKALFDGSLGEWIEKKLTMPTARGLVCFENIDFGSSRFGDRTAMVVGDDCTYKTVEECEGRHLYDLPSQRQYATHYYKVGQS